jgi:dihydroflavonol-4-reductase
MALAVVTGASGFIGTHLVAHLRALQWDVIALARRSAKTARLEALGAKIVHVDIVDRTAMLAAVPMGVDVLFHLACAPFGSGFQADYISRVNEDGLRNALFAATDKKTTCTVYLSDAICFGTHDGVITEKSGLAEPKDLHGPYARSKRECEAILGRAIARGLDAVSLMSSAVLGEGLRAYRAAPFIGAITSEAVTAPGGGRCFVDVEALVPLLVRAAEKGMTGQRYLVGGPYQNWADIVQRFIDVNGLSTTLTAPGRFNDFLHASANRLKALAGRGRADSIDAWMWAHKQQISADLSQSDLGFLPSDPDKALTKLYTSLCQA